ncbi:hypothetical protein CRM22_003313 [Opisthorchis felineus]|uniref:Ig-like domain-containing protein n=1 Tax=Opisthorchis felineus TaxID=147828 RepID=A0A4S2M7Z5_OPIFE|nr:hypothetical protein CRM22_003313 [Opisthorchis felineus]
MAGSASETVFADELLNIMANKTVHLISSSHHSSRIEILMNREMHKKILRCTVHSQLKRPASQHESEPLVVTSSASLELNILYGPRIKRQETAYVPIRLPNPEDHISSDHLVLPDEESGLWNSTTLAWLECETDSNPPAHISWYFRLPNGSMQLTGFETRQPVKLYQYGNLLPALSRYYVSIVSTTSGTKDTNDEVDQRSGQEEHILRSLWNFTCEAYSSGFPRQRASRLVGLADVPMLTGRNQVFVRIGQAVELQCDIRSLPAPFKSSIYWNFHPIFFKEDPRNLHPFTFSSAAVERYGATDLNILEVHQLLVSRQWIITNEEVVLGWISRLRIQHVTEKHFGLYNCSARNELGGGWHITLLRQAQSDGKGFLRMEYMVHLLTGILFAAVFGCLCYLIWFRKLICHGWVSPLAWKFTCMRSQSSMRSPVSIKKGPSVMMENAPRFLSRTYPKHSYVETFHVIANQLDSPGLCECGPDLLYTEQLEECSAIPPMEFQIIRGGPTLPTEKLTDERRTLQQTHRENTEETITRQTSNSFSYNDLLKNRPLINREGDNFQLSNNPDFSRSQAISQRLQRLPSAHQMLSFNNQSSNTTLASSYDSQHWTRFHTSATWNAQTPRRIKYGNGCKRAARRTSSPENQPYNMPPLLPSTVKEK